MCYCVSWLQHVQLTNTSNTHHSVSFSPAARLISQELQPWVQNLQHKGRKQLLLWLTAFNDAPYKCHWYESPKQRNEEISLNYPLCNTPGIYIHTFPHWITLSERNGIYRTTNGNYMFYKRGVSWDKCLLWHQHVLEDFNKDTCERYCVSSLLAYSFFTQEKALLGSFKGY